MLSFPEAAELADEVRRLLEDLQHDHAHDAAPGGLYAPPMDVVEREDAVEVVMDLAGVAPDDVRILFKNNTLVIAGCKWPAGGPSARTTAFHLVERSFGRFARAIRISATLDLGKARATMAEGELRVRLPLLNNGHEFVIPIEKVV